MALARAERGVNPVALLASWLVLAAGLLLIGTIVLGPDTDRVLVARGQTALLASRLDWWERRGEAHGSFLVALERDDPVVLEHLALTELNRVVRGKQLYNEGDARFGSAGGAMLGHLGTWIDRAAGPLRTPSVEAPQEGWLDQLPTTKRTGLVIAGGLFVVAGLLWNPVGRREDI
ncbi:MAG: hypothetical protein RLN76_01065 [Phycisphaeraceae bacterium]